MGVLRGGLEEGGGLRCFALDRSAIPLPSTPLILPPPLPPHLPHEWHQLQGLGQVHQRRVMMLGAEGAASLATALPGVSVPAHTSVNTEVNVSQMWA